MHVCAHTCMCLYVYVSARALVSMCIQTGCEPRATPVAGSPGCGGQAQLFTRVLGAELRSSCVASRSFSTEPPPSPMPAQVCGAWRRMPGHVGRRGLSL